MSQTKRHTAPARRRSEVAESPTRPNLQVIRRRSRALIKRGRARRLAPAAILAAIVVGGVVLAILLEQVVLAQSAFELTRLRKGLVTAQSRHETLLLEAAELDSPSRIETYARDALGMVEPTNPDYVVADVRVRAGGGRLAARSSGGSAQPGDGVAAGARGSSSGSGTTLRDFLPSAAGTSPGDD